MGDHGMQLNESTATIPVGDRNLDGSIFIPNRSDKRPAVLFLHGDGSSRRPHSERARTVTRALQCYCLTYDMSGHGDDAHNYHQYTVVDHLDDAVAAFDYLSTLQGVDSRRIGVCGASYGAYLAALLSNRRPHIKRLVLRAPSLVSDLDPPLPVDRLVEFDSLSALRRFCGDVLVVESELDEVIPHTHIEAYLTASTSRAHTVIPNAMHSLTEPQWNAFLTECVTGWMAKL